MLRAIIVGIMSIGLLSGCLSNYEEFTERKPMNEITNAGPYSISINGYNPEATNLMKTYIKNNFGKSLSFSENAKSTLDFTFVSEATANNLATWRDGTGFISIQDQDKQTLWSGEYNYKGGNEMSGFSVRTDIEAAKITIARLYEKFSAN
jgi:hypothetical protein